MKKVDARQGYKIKLTVHRFANAEILSVDRNTTDVT